ncbi:MAG TPA: MerR family transcriptional regulator [Pseudonocardiaceae bacterium]
MDAHHSIGDLARLTGVPVTAIRFYSDHGILPPTARTAAGYRRYTEADRDRLDLVRTLRDLGFDLSTVAKVLRGDVDLAQVAAEGADALASHIRALRVRYAVLVAVAERGANPEELVQMYARAVVDEFLDAVFDRPGFAGIRATMTPYLPEDAEPAQVAAWDELAELTRDEEFRAVMRAIVDRHDPTVLRRDRIAAVRDEVAPALAAHVDPESAEAVAVLGPVTATGVTVRDLELANDPRRARYVELLAVINGWAAPESLSPALDWAIAALRSSPAS